MMEYLGFYVLKYEYVYVKFAAYGMEFYRI